MASVRNWVKASLKCRETGGERYMMRQKNSGAKLQRILRTMLRNLVFNLRVLHAQGRI